MSLEYLQIDKKMMMKLKVQVITNLFSASYRTKIIVRNVNLGVVSFDRDSLDAKLVESTMFITHVLLINLYMQTHRFSRDNTVVE